jgi:hypothetical protein
MAEVQLHWLLLQERIEMEPCRLVHVLSAVDFQVLADVKSRESHLLEIQGYFHGVVWNCHWWEDPIHSLARLPGLESLGLYIMISITYAEMDLFSRVTYRFENNLLALPRSCDGDPAPDRVFPAILPAAVKLPGWPKGDRRAFPLEGSVPVGEVFAVEEPDRGRETAGCGRYPKLGCSDLADDIIYYPFRQNSLGILLTGDGLVDLKCIERSILVPGSSTKLTTEHATICGSRLTSRNRRIESCRGKMELEM